MSISIYYHPKPNTVFCHLEEMVDLSDPIFTGRVFSYLGGLGLVYSYTDQHRNCSAPLTHAEFVKLRPTLMESN